MISLVQPQSHRKGRRWRRFVRENGTLFFVFFVIIIILVLVGALFYVMSSSRFVNPQ